jgi:hypothetical protein
MNRKFKSEAMEALYEDALAHFEVGGISEERMRYYQNACLVPDAAVGQTAKSLGSSPIATRTMSLEYFAGCENR